MKVNNSLDYTFKIKSYDSTKEKHQNIINKLKERKIKFEDIFGYTDMADSIANDVCYPSRQAGSLWFSYHYKKQVEEKGEITQNLLRELKTSVNGETRQFIEEQLKYNDLPKSWTTAFYIKHYKRVNELMIKATKIIIREYV